MGAECWLWWVSCVEGGHNTLWVKHMLIWIYTNQGVYCNDVFPVVCLELPAFVNNGIVYIWACICVEKNMNSSSYESMFGVPSKKGPACNANPCVSHSNVFISLVKWAPVLSRRHVTSNTTDLTCVITCRARLWPGQRHPVITRPIKQPWLSLLEAAHCHLKAFKRTKQIPAQSQGPELCEHVWAVWWTHISRGSEMLCVWCRMCNFLALFSPPTDMEGSHRI